MQHFYFVRIGSIHTSYLVYTFQKLHKKQFIVASFFLKLYYSYLLHDLRGESAKNQKRGTTESKRGAEKRKISTCPGNL